MMHINESRCIIVKEKNTFCGSRNSSKGRFIDASLLCLLKIEDSYGYSLMKNLSQFGFTEDEVDISTIYRKLRAMEKDNLVISSWSDSEQGPRKRIYIITDLGLEELDNWMEFLDDRKKRITMIISKYKELQ